MGMLRREFLAAGAAGAATGQAKTPNIVFILLDDLGLGDVGCYGQKKILTPNIDSLAREGTRLTEAYAGGPVCAPSRCVLMTGLHGGHARIRSNAGTAPIGPSDKTFASWLQAQGYVCGGFGKWGLGDAGSTGNADPRVPHLHMAIFELGPLKQWWKGTPLNPYPPLVAAVKNSIDRGFR